MLFCESLSINEAATVNACKNGGWQQLTRPDGTTFENQGDCIQYVNTVPQTHAGPFVSARYRQTQHEPDPAAERRPEHSRNRDRDQDAAKQIATVVGDDPNRLMVDHRPPCGRVVC